MAANKPATSLRSSLLRLMLIPALLVLLILFGIIGISVRLILSDVENEQTLVVHTIARLDERYLNETQILLGNIAAVIMELPPADRNHLLEHTHGNYPRFTAIYLLDDAGIVLNERKSSNAQSLIGFDLSGEIYFKAAKEDQQVYFSDTFFSISTDDVAVTIAQPIIREDDFVGVLVGEMNLIDLQETIQRLSFRDTDTIFIVDDRATVIAHPDSQLVRQQVNMGEVTLIRNATGEASIEIAQMNSEWVVASSIRMENGWVVVTHRPVINAFQPLIILVVVSLLAFFSSTVILVLGVLRSVYRISSPIANLATKVDAISQGNYARLGDDATSGRYRELNALGVGFNRMVEAIEARTSELLTANERLRIELEERQRIEAALRESENRFRGLFEGTPVATLEEDFSEIKILLDKLKETCNGDWNLCLKQNPNIGDECAQLVKIISVNEATVRMHNVKSKADLLNGLSGMFKSDVPATFLQELEAIWDGRTNLELESIRYQPNGAMLSYSIIKWSALPAYKLPYDRVLVSIVDITDLKRAEMELHQHREHLEELVRERTDELEQANQELESFAYTVSHDLRAPLRHIDAYSGILVKDFADQLDEQGRAFLENVRRGSQNMSRMIDGLLQLSRASRGELHYSHVDLSALADEISQELHETEPDRQVDWMLTPGCMVEGDGRLLRAALQNLLGNAWKFTQFRKKAQISFGSLSDDEASSKYNTNSPVYFVKDNGAGFEMKYVNRLFTPFQRLHSESEFAGTGIGLATVQRIIRRHGGDIWVESALDVGTTFYFTLT